MQTIFRARTAAMVLGLLNALLFHAGVFRGVTRWDVGAGVPAVAKTSAVASLTLWVGVIACGRLLAYL
jgi:hypothetical protein